MKKIPVAFLATLVLAASAAMASGPAADPVVGTWKLNVAKSKFTHGPALKSDIRTYTESADGMISVTLKSVSDDGKETTLTRMFKQDGKDYPVNDSSGVDSISETSVNAHTAKYAEKKAGKVLLTGHRVLSKDGKRLTVFETGLDPTGARIQRTLVYDRQ